MLVVAKRKYYFVDADQVYDSTGRFSYRPVAEMLGKVAPLVYGARRILGESLPREPNAETHYRSSGGYSGVLRYHASRKAVADPSTA